MRKKLLFICSFLILMGSGMLTQVNAQYCAPVYTNACSSDDYINSVTLNTISNLATGCTGGLPSNLTDYSATDSTTVLPGSSYTISVVNNPDWAEWQAVWFDWNQDGDFQDAGEYTSLGQIATSATGTASITVPANASPGATRMRVRCKWGGTIMLQSEVCASMGYGETEDYMVYVLDTFCVPVYTSSCATDFIDSVAMGSIQNGPTGCSGGTPANYTNYSDSLRDTINQGSSKSIYVKIDPQYAQGVGVWVDWNRNGDFTDAGEFTSLGLVSAGGTGTALINCPPTALTGVSRMRVRCIYNTAVASGDVCNSQTWGEVEDYALLIGDAPAINAGMDTLYGLASGCGLGIDSLRFDLLNLGGNTITTFQACYSVNGGAPVCETFTTSLPFNAAAPFVFSTPVNLSVMGSYNIDSWVNLTGDTDASNDTLAGYTLINFDNISTFPYVEDFEGGPATWTPMGTNSSWDFGTPNKTVIQGAASGMNAWVTGLDTADTYNVNENSWVISPCFDFSSLTTPWLGMDIWVDSESSWDGTVIEYSLDSGMTWIEIGMMGDPWNWYNDSTIDGLSAVGNTGHGWTATSGGWVRASHELTALAGAANVRFRIHFGSDGSVVDDGFAFDNFIIAEPLVVNLGNDTAACNSHVLAPLVPANGQFFWSNGDSLPSVTVTTTDTLGLAYVDSLGFASVDSAVIVTINTPVVPNIGSDALVCIGDTACFSESGFASYLWSSGDTTSNTCVTMTGSLILSTTDMNGCSASDTAMVSNFAMTPVNIGPDQLVCDGEMACFGINSADFMSYSWSTGDSSDTTCVMVSGMVSIAVVDTNGCNATDTSMVTVKPLPIINIGPDQAICDGDTACFDAGMGTMYVWSTGGSTQIECLTSAGMVDVMVADTFGCLGYDTAMVTLNANAIAAASMDTSLCPIIAFTDNSTGSPTSWSWDFGDGNSSAMQNPTNDYTIAGNGSYSVVFVATNACNSDTMVIPMEITCLVGLGTAIAQDFKLWPNPNHGKFQIETLLSSQVPVSVEVFDLRGQNVFSRDLGMQSGLFNTTIEIRDISKGVYFVILKAGEEVINSKIKVE